MWPLRLKAQNQTVVNGQTTAPIQLPASTTCTYRWTNDTPGIGLAADNGTGDVPSFTAINNGSQPITATFTFTPVPKPPLAYIPSQSTNMLTVLDLTTGRAITKIQLSGKPYGITISRDNSRVYVSCSDGFLDVIDAASNTVMHTYTIADADLRGVAVTPDMSKIYVADFSHQNNTGSVKIIDIHISNIGSIPEPEPSGLVINNNGDTLYIAGGIARQIITQDDRPKFVTDPYGPGDTYIKLSNDGTKIYTAGSTYFEGPHDPNFPTYNDGIIKDGEIYNIITGQNLYYTTTEGDAFALVASQGDDMLFITSPSTNKVSVVTTNSRRQIASIPVDHKPYGIDIGPDGKIYVLNYDSHTISVINPDPNDLSVINTITLEDGHPFAFGNFITHEACTGQPFTVTITINPTPPTIIATGTPGPLTTPANSESPSTSFKVSGINLLQGIAVDPPNGYELSTDDVHFGPTLVIGAGGNIPATPVYVRLKAGLTVGSYPGDITLTSTPATPVNVPLNGTVTFAMQNITTSFVRGSIYACAGSASESPQVQQFSVSGELLVDDIKATAPNGFEVSLSPGQGYGSSVIIPQSGGVVNNVSVYVRSAATASGNISGNVTLTSNGALTRDKTVSATVGTPPTVDHMDDKSFIAGSVTTLIHFTGTGGAYTWHNDTPNIGLPQDGGGDIAPFMAANTTGRRETATITVTPDNQQLAYIPVRGVQNEVEIVNTSTQQVVGHIPVNEVPYAITLSPDGSTVYVTNQSSGNISVISTATNTVINTITTLPNPSGIAISPDGSTVYVSYYNTNKIEAIIIAGTPPYAHIPITVGNGPDGIAVSPDGKWVYVTNRNSNSVSVINTVTNTEIAQKPVQQSPQGLAISPDGNTVYVTNYNSRSVSVFNTTTNDISTIPVGANPRGITVSPDGGKIYVTNGGTSSNSVSVIDAVTLLVTNISVGNVPEGVSVSPDGKLVCVANKNSQNLSVIRASDNQVIASIPLNGSPVSFGNFIIPASGCVGTPVTFHITVDAQPALITATGTLAALSTTYGTASSATSFTVSGSGLTQTISITPPNGFEVSTDNHTFSTGIQIGMASIVPTTNVYLRLAATSPVGTYSGNISVRSAGAPDIDYATANSTVNPATLTIRADDQARALGTPNPVLTATYTGFVNNETTSVLTTLPTISTTANESSPVGQYPIAVSGAGATNYTFNYIPGVLTVSAEEQALVIPNTFTPNNDGINDTWTIKNMSTYASFTVSIFNRNGQQLYFSNRYAMPWDGRYRGAELPAGTYYYVINADSKTLSGYVTIIR
jgi:gliding motility-associated-like protein